MMVAGGCNRVAKKDPEAMAQEESESQAKKGRGGARQRTAKAADENKQEEQMDLKPESEDMKEEAAPQVTDKRKRGARRTAKPKEEVEEEETRDNNSEMNEGEEITPVATEPEKMKAKRGRKPVVETEDETEVPVRAKKRGRAAAAQKKEVTEEDNEPAVKKRRGRKPAVKTDEVEETVAAANQKGRKGKRAATAVMKVNEEEAQEAPASTSIKGKGRGKASKKEVVVKKDETSASIGAIQESASTTKVSDGRNEEDNEPAVKKEVTEEDNEPAVKKRRGRKPAVKTEEVEETVDAANQKGKKGKRAATALRKVNEEEAQEAPASTSIKGKGRGKASKKEAVVKKDETSASNGAIQEAASTTKVSGVDRVVVVKGRAAVDALCPIAQHSHVYEEDDDIWDCMLNQTNIQNNNNKYYLIQLLEDDSSKSYSVWMRWGRVGANGQNSLQPCGSNLDKAMNIFRKKFSDKTRNDWEFRLMFEKVPGKYDLLKMDYSKAPDTTDAPSVKSKKAAVESLLHPILKAIIELICDVRRMEESVVEMKYDAKKAPLGKLTTEQIKAGYLALKHIDDLIQSGKQTSKDLLHACNDFYTRIPHYFGMKVPPLIRTSAEVREKVALLEALGDIQAALSVLDKPIDVDTHPADQHYSSLKCDMTPLAKDSEDYKIIEKYMHTTHAKTHNQYKLQLLEVLQCYKESEHQRFKDVGNRMLLWHGSRMSNWAGILSQGLRIAPPEAPVTGYMFGKGIYFADMASKSANYCWANSRNNTGFLLLSEVALGKSNELLDADYSANKLPKGYQSVKGCGKTAPKPQNFTKLGDGTVVPIGPGVPMAAKTGTNYSLLYNEYIVYDPAQVRTRFLLKVQFNFNNMY